MSAAFQDISANPANISKYQNNPKIQKLMKKMSMKFAGPEGDDEEMPDGAPSPAGDSPGAGSKKFSEVPPQPDID